MKFCSKFLVVMLLFCVVITTSCKPVQVVRLIQSENIKPLEWTNREKTVRFIPMHHIGKQEFYDRVRDEVKASKEKGFVVYYESAKITNKIDPAELEIIEKKFRKMMGFHLDTLGYSQLLPRSGIFLNLVDQPKYEDLGVDKSDIRVDVSKDELVTAYEEIFGTIKLSDYDERTSLNSRYDGSHRLLKENVMFVIIEVRNQHLAEYINASADKKIVVLYGADHAKGTFRELKNLDGRWRRRS